MDAIGLEEQLSTLAEFGFTLEPGVGIDDFLITVTVITVTVYLTPKLAWRP